MSVLQTASYSWRSLRRAPVFTAAVVLTLTIGIGAAAAIFTVVNGVLLRPLPYGDADRLVGAWFDLPPVHMLHAQQTGGTYFTFKKYGSTIEDIAEYQDGSASVNDPDGRVDPQRMDVAWVSANTFKLLRVSPMLGRTFSDAEDAPKGPTTVVLSEGVWRSRFGGDRNVIGKRLIVSGRSAEIIGVMPGRFRFPNDQTKLWLASQLDPANQFPGGFNYSSVARLKPGVTIEAAERDLTNVLPRMLELYPDVAPGVPTKMLLDQARPIPKLVPMRDDLVGDIARTLWIVAATAGLVLLVTCANVANLLLVRADGRHRELSVRAALGAGRGQVLAQFFAESAVLAAISSVLALGATWVGIRMLVNAGPRQIPRLAEIHVDAMTVLFTVIVAVLVAAVCSVIPAVRFMRGGALSGLREGGRSGTVGGKRQRARSVLVAAQMAFALIVLSASGLLIRSFQRLHAVKPGFNPDGVATVWVSLPSARYAATGDVVRFYSRLTDRVREIPGVQSAGMASRIPLVDRNMSSDPMYVEGDETYAKAIPPLQLYTKADGEYFKTMGIPLLAGRTFDRMDALREPDAVIISQRTAEQFFHDSTGRAAIGKRVRELPNAPWHTVIGVVGSVRDTSLSAAPMGTVYFPEAQGPDSLDAGVSRTMAIVARTNGDVLGISRAIQRVIHDADPTLPTFDVRPMREVMAGSIARLSFTMVILGVAAAVTLVLGVIGLYGVIAYIVTLRTREIGVRIALGAQPSSVMAMVTRQGLVLCASGVVVGVALSLVVARFLRTLLFEVAPTDPLTLGSASAILLAFALLATWIPARRASQVNPTEALRAD